MALAMSNLFRTPHRSLVSLLAALSLALGLIAVPTSSASAATRLSNGCSMSSRGIPSCGALMGGAYGANDNPASWEKVLGRPLGVHRLFFRPGQVGGAVRMAKADLAKDRLPWISFKVPYSWSAMASGKGDAWVKDVARRMASVGGPVWLAFAHEPEEEGDIQAWKRMQARIAPMVRRIAPNVGYTIILMGYHEFYGASKYRMSNIWPKTKIDLVGFDVYDHYGKNGSTRHTDMGAYFDKFKAWSKSSGVPWGLAESGISHRGAAHRPGWFKDTYSKLVARGGKAFAYFNTNLNSFQDWRLTTTIKRDRFRATFRTSPTM